MISRARHFRPFASSGRTTIVAIFITFALISTLTVALSIRATGRSQNGATVVEVVGRQRTLAERYVKEVLLVGTGMPADPALTASILAQSAHALLDGGVAPAVNGDDDEIKLAPVSGVVVRGQIVEEAKLVRDLSTFGAAMLARRPLAHVPVTGGETIGPADPIGRLRILGDLVSVVALNSSRTLAGQADQNITDLIGMQIALGVGGLIVSLLLAWALIATTRRQTAHFRSLVTSSSDLVIVLGAKGCRYVSRSLCSMVGRAEAELLGDGLWQFIHEDDRGAVSQAQRDGEPAAMLVRIRNASGDWRHLEAHLTDLRQDRHLRGVVINARDVTERVALEHELMRQSQRDTFASQLSEALEMADEEHTAYDVVERAMVEISPNAPMELLLADASRAHLQRAAASPTSGAPGCPVQSPFSCVAVRRGQPVSFESGEALNACPKLRDRPGGPCSAVCVPVSFMGRALGVLHATGPDRQAPVAEQIAQLTTLATQAGGRIGTVRAFQKTQLQASTDGLTGLVNRRTVETEIRGLIDARAVFALAVADLDRFKMINDTHGHHTGDRALRSFAQAAQEALRDQDILARWGGEEFVLVLAELDRHQAIAVLNRIRDKLAQAPTRDHPRFTVSFGVTDSSAASSLEQLMQIADLGLYQSKDNGRDRVTVGRLDPAAAELQPYREPDPLSEPAHTRLMTPLLHETADDQDPRSAVSSR